MNDILRSSIFVMSADNELESVGLETVETFKNLATPGSSRIHIGALLDISKKTLIVNYPPVPVAGHDESSKEQKITDPAVLREILTHLLRDSKLIAPQATRSLVIWGHGRGSKVLSEGDDGNASVSSAGLAELVGKLHVEDIKNFIVIFDACLMAMSEGLAEYAGVADSVLASANIVPSDGLPYETIFKSPVLLNPASTSSEIAKVYVDEYTAARGADRLLLHVDPRKLQHAMADLNHLGDFLTARLPAFKNKLAASLRNSKRVDEFTDLVDAVSFCDQFINFVPSDGPPEDEAEAVKLAQNLSDSIKRSCLYINEEMIPHSGSAPIYPLIWCPWKPEFFELFSQKYLQFKSSRTANGKVAGWAKLWFSLHGVDPDGELHRRAAGRPSPSPLSMVAQSRLTHAK